MKKFEQRNFEFLIFLNVFSLFCSFCFFTADTFGNFELELLLLSVLSSDCVLFRSFRLKLADRRGGVE